jgi:hypothetical protein
MTIPSDLGVTPNTPGFTKTVFRNLEDAVAEALTWDDEIEVRITLESNGLYQIYGHGVQVWSSSKT